MDKDKIAKLQAQVRIGQWGGAMHGDGEGADCMPILLNDYRYLYLHPNWHTAVARLFRRLRLPLNVSRDWPLGLCNAPMDQFDNGRLLRWTN